MNKTYILFWIFIIIGTFLESVGDICFRYATVANKELYRWLGYIVYILGSAAWDVSLKYHELTKGLIIFISINVLMVAIASRYMFAEYLTTTQIIGMILCLIGVFLIEN